MLAVLFARELPGLVRHRKADVRRGAERIASILERSFASRHEMRPASAADFPGRDISFYDVTRRGLESLGYRFLGDIEDLTLNQANPASRTFIRCMLSPDGASYAGFFDARPRGANFFLAVLTGGWHFKAVDLETELESGAFVVTTTAVAAGWMSLPSGMWRRIFPPGTSVRRLVETHSAEVKKRADEAGSRPLVLRTLDDVLDSQRRQQELISRFRSSLKGGLTDAEKEHFSRGFNWAVAKGVFSELEKIIAERRASAGGDRK